MANRKQNVSLGNAKIGLRSFLDEPFPSQGGE